MPPLSRLVRQKIVAGDAPAPDAGDAPRGLLKRALLALLRRPRRPLRRRTIKMAQHATQPTSTMTLTTTPATADGGSAPEEPGEVSAPGGLDGDGDGYGAPTRGGAPR